MMVESLNEHTCRKGTCMPCRYVYTIIIMYLQLGFFRLRILHYHHNIAHHPLRKFHCDIGAVENQYLIAVCLHQDSNSLCMYATHTHTQWPLLAVYYSVLGWSNVTALHITQVTAIEEQ